MQPGAQHMLCATCQAPTTLPAFGGHHDVLRDIPNVRDELMSLLALHATANAGCNRCAIILEAVNNWQNGRGDFHHVECPDQYVVGIAPMPKPGAKAARTGAVGLAVAVTRREGWEHYNYLSWSRNDHLWEFDVKFELYTECTATSAKYHIPCLNSVPSQPRPKDYASQAKQWLNECLSNHSGRCSDMVQQLPTRVIDVGDAVVRPRLIVMKPNERNTYCALSYCWGQSRAFTTTKATLEDRQKHFELEELPNTVRDAVLLTRALGIPFLWVDSICIIQDSADDWAREAARMCDVYTRAAITIAAIDSPASETGLFIAGSGRRRIRLNEERLPIYARTHSHSGLDDPRALQRDGTQARILHTRGWCLQEIALSTRVLWMKSSEMNWSCIQSSACECDPMPTDILHHSNLVALEFFLSGVRHRELQQSHPSQWLDLWKGLVLEYTGRRLTHISDRLPAIAGLATLIHRHLDTRYLFGLWETSGFLEQLLWSSLTHADESEWAEYTSKARIKLTPDLAPSWSWASSSAHVSIPHEGYSETAESSGITHSVALRCDETRVWSLRSISVETNKLNLFGVGTGVLELYTLLVPVQVHTHKSNGELVRSLVHAPSQSPPSVEDAPLVLIRAFDWLTRCNIEDKDRNFRFDVWRRDSRIDYDDDPEWYATRDLFFIFANTGVHEQGNVHTFDGLILEKLDSHVTTGATFRRLGYGEGVFLNADGAHPGVQIVSDDFLGLSEPEIFDRATWEYWRELGTWRTIHLV